MNKRLPRKFLLFSSIIMLVSIIVSGCVHSNRFLDFYDSVLEPEFFPDIIKLQKNEEPMIVESTDYQKDVEELLAKNYEIIGFSTFEGQSQDDNDAITVAKKIGATLVVLERRYITSTTSTYSLPTTQTTYYSGTFSGRSTTYGVSGAPITVSNHFFEHTAVFLAKRATIGRFGLIFSDLTPDERVAYERNTGAVIRVVIEDSAAFYSNLLKGDLIISIDDNVIHNYNQASEAMGNVDKGAKHSKFIIVRNGIEKEIIVNFL